MPEPNTRNDAQSLDHPDADFIIRSSDGVDFHVHALLLRLASPIFNDMFALPRTPDIDETKDGLPIVDLAEDGRTIQILLSSCYPAVYGGPEGIKGLSEISALLGNMIYQLSKRVRLSSLSGPFFKDRATPSLCYRMPT